MRSVSPMRTTSQVEAAVGAAASERIFGYGVNTAAPGVRTRLPENNPAYGYAMGGSAPTMHSVVDEGAFYENYGWYNEVRA